MTVRIYSRTSLYGVAVLLAVMLACAQPGGDDAGGIAIDPDDIGGTVTSTAGPEAGVWVIAETTELPTTFARVVVTDDQGRYVLPDLPAANYDVFVRGYGLVDSARVTAMPGQHLDLDAVVAPDGQAAAATYPPGSWLSLLEVPEGDVPTMEVVSAIKECLQCHAIGNAATREIPARYADVSSREAWDQRTSGAVFGLMPSIYARLGPQAQMFADWTDAIAAGAYPEQAPPRPAGLERNAVISVWELGHAGRHPKRRPGHARVGADVQRQRSRVRCPHERHHDRVGGPADEHGREDRDRGGGVAQQRHRRGRASVGHRQPCAGLVAVGFLQAWIGQHVHGVFSNGAPRQADRGVRPTH